MSKLIADNRHAEWDVAMAALVCELDLPDRLFSPIRDILGPGLGRVFFREWLLRNYPDRYRHVMSLIRSMRGGKDYDAEFGKRMKGAGPYAWQIGRRFELAAKRLGLNLNRRQLRDDIFVPPLGTGVQLSLL